VRHWGVSYVCVPLPLQMLQDITYKAMIRSHSSRQRGPDIYGHILQPACMVCVCRLRLRSHMGGSRAYEITVRTQGIRLLQWLA
jgi:hypothetical protein